MTVSSARRILGLSPFAPFDLTQLRTAYFESAKKTHPDTKEQQPDDDVDSSNSNTKKSSHMDFVALTQAYQLLQQHTSCGTLSRKTRYSHNGKTAEGLTPQQYEDNYRTACADRLGVDARIVEECKQNADFLQWLAGRSDAAHTWRDFLSNWGGLAPVLSVDDDENDMGVATLSSSSMNRPVRRRRRGR